MLSRIQFGSFALAMALVAGACGDNSSADPDAMPSADADDRPMVADPTLMDGFDTPAGEALAFGIEEGTIRNYFFQQGEVAVHLLTRSDTEPRIIAAYPANNEGLGLWFKQVTGNVDIWVGDKEMIATGGGLKGLVRKGEDTAPNKLRGIRAVVEADAQALEINLAILGNVRSIRDYGYGYPFNINANDTELIKPQFELLRTDNGDVLRISRTMFGGDFHKEFLIKPIGGTQIKLAPNNTNYVLANSATIKFELIALADEPPLTPFNKANELLATDPAGAELNSFELNALAFLAYKEKMLAGSWRFLTYFGRDTLLSIRMLMSNLKPEVIEGALGSVIERINLDPAAKDFFGEFTIEAGDISHEEAIGDYAAWHRSNRDPAPANDELRQDIQDYKMVDDDFMLAPVLVEFFRLFPDRAAAFLERTLPADTSKTYQDAIVANLELVFSRAEPYAGSKNKLDLVILKKDGDGNQIPVGEWRDSSIGLGTGLYAFNVNAALVPAALAAAQQLYANQLSGVTDAATKATEAQALFADWQGVENHFLVNVDTVANAKTQVETYAGQIQLKPDVAEQIAADSDTTAGEVKFYALSLDAQRQPIKIMHSDHGFTMVFTNPTDEYLQRVTANITRTFPAGLFSPVGMMVANPVFGAEDEVMVPQDNDTFATRRLKELFTNSDYHGTLVWSWQQALLALGFQIQLERADIAAETRAALEVAQCELWKLIIATNAAKTGELWSWSANADGVPELQPFGYNSQDVDESNAAQLWSTVYLAVKPPKDPAEYTMDLNCTTSLRSK